MKLLSEQVNDQEIKVILKYLEESMKNTSEGAIAEFGCYVGTTSVWISKAIEKTDRKFYVYDSFEGLPKKTDKDESPLGTNFKEGELIATKKQFIENIKKFGAHMPVIKKAWFDKLTPSDVPEKISFAFLDGDYYQSIKTSLKLIENNMVKNGIIIIDDYDNSALPGAQKAVDEWTSRKHLDKITKNSLAIIKIPS